VLRVNRILFPTDFSPASDSALAPACHWARTLDAELHLVHAMVSPLADVPARLGVDQSAGAYLPFEEAREEIETRHRRARSQTTKVTCCTVDGAAGPSILDYAEAHDIDLIVMSTHGRRGFRRLLLGSVAEEVVQRSSCPVLTVGADSAFGQRPWPLRILVAVDLSDHSGAALAYGKQLAAIFGAEMQLLHVIVRPPLPAYFDGAPLPALWFEPRQLEKEALAALESLHAKTGGPHAPATLQVEHGGHAAQHILRYAAVHSSELIVVASHGLTGVSHLLMGSVSQQVVREAPCPVFTLKSFGKSLLAQPTVAAGSTAVEPGD
jgi:nucleotide-binding universal stress UspA family protein